MLTTATSAAQENNGATPASFLSLVNSRKVASACIIELNEENGIRREGLPYPYDIDKVMS